jgi:squalene cyclase
MGVPRRLLTAIALGAAASLAAATRAEEPRAAIAGAGPPAQSRIDAAVAMGVAWLRGEQARDGAFGPQPGETALALLALRHSGVAEDDAACRRASAHLVRELPDGTSYGASLGVVALLGQEGKAARDEAVALAGELVRAQCENGQWSYAARRTSSAKAGDNSNTQLAVLALAAARARGVDVPRSAFDRVAAWFRETQNDDGGWGYAKNERSASYASMTAGAVMSLALAAKDHAPGGAGLAEVPEIRRGLAWLARGFDPGRNAGAAEAFGSKKGRRSDDFWRHYWLWSLERACSCAGAPRLAERDWYADGARFLLERQRDDGSWVGPEKGVLATSFALLFLSRGTLRVVTPRACDAVETPR